MTREEAIEVYNGLINEKIKEAFEFFAPELRESEDERIRKELIFFLKEEIPQCSIKEHADKLKEFVAYLERKKEQTPYGQREECLDCQMNYAGACKGSCSMKRNEQKPAEWSEDYREEDIQTRFAFYTYKDDPSVLYLSNVFVEETSRNHGFGTRILKAAEKVAEAIGAVTICLKVKQYSPANTWYRKRGYGFVTFEDGYDWLEKNLEYLKPAKSAEWSEEDEAMLDSVIRIITQFDDLAHEPTFAGPKWTHPYTKELNFLNGLRNRLFNKND